MRVAVLGSTGSIGRQALDVLTAHPDRFDIVALAAGRDTSTLDQQIAAHQPRLTATAVDGVDALVDIATDPGVDFVLIGTAGIISLKPTIAALEAGKLVATANKETLVAGGHVVMPLARLRAEQSGTTPLSWLRPIDSEHSAIWQCLVGEDRADVTRIIVTGSGGPFRTWTAERIAAASPDDALNHPTWSMGAKVTIDSATLMNKALEVIEARWLYDVDDAQIDVVIHPQSIVHSMVEFADGSIKAQLGLPDMRIPIQYALTYPERSSSPAPRLVGSEIPSLTFEPVDETRFPALAMGREAGRRGPAASAALIAADDIAVERFLAGSLDFPGIARLCELAVDRAAGEAPDVDELIALDAEVRRWAETVDVRATSGVTHA